MASQNKTKAPWRLSRSLRALHNNERGTAMTEFVIMLPVFLLLFVGINELFKTNKAAFRVKATAAKMTWKASMDVANAGQFGAFTHKVPFIAAAQEFGRTTGDGIPKAMSMVRSAGLLSDASAGEADRATTILSIAGQDTPSGDYPTTSGTFPTYITDDSKTNSVSTWGPLGVYAPSAALSNIGPNQPWAAGIRYGLVKGEFSETYESPVGSVDMGDEYSMLVPPGSIRGIVGEHITIGFSRLSARKDKCLKNVLKIDYSLSYISNCL